MNVLASLPLAVDPLFTAGVGLEEVIIFLIKVVAA